MSEDGGVCTSAVPQLQGVHCTRACSTLTDTRRDARTGLDIDRQSTARPSYTASVHTIRRRPVHHDATPAAVTSSDHVVPGEACSLPHDLLGGNKVTPATRSDDDKAKGMVLCASCAATVALAHRTRAAAHHESQSSICGDQWATGSTTLAQSRAAEVAAEQILAQLRVDELWARVEAGAMEVFRLTRRRDLARVHRCGCQAASLEQHGPTQLGQSEEDLRGYLVHYRSSVDAFVQACNLAALRLLNDHRYSFALQVLLRAQEVVRPNAGRRFRYVPSAREHALRSGMEGANVGDDGGCAGTKTDSAAANDGQCAEEESHDVDTSSTQSEAGGGGWWQMYVPYYDAASETARQRAAAVVDNNFGLYHFELGEYDLACDRLARAAVQEEGLSVDSLGITYYNLAQAQYRLNRSAPELAMNWLRLAAAAVERRVQTGASALQTRQTAANAGDGDKGTAARSTRTTTTFTALWLKWRDAVCLLARVKWQLGVWLQRAGDYQAALRHYEESLRWLGGAGTLSGEELDRVARLTRRIQGCRRAMHAQRAASRARRVVSPGLDRMAAVTPSRDVTPSRVVTTLLPRHVEVIDTAVPMTAARATVPFFRAGRRRSVLPPQQRQQRRRERGAAPWCSETRLPHAPAGAAHKTVPRPTPPLVRRQDKQQPRQSAVRRRSSASTAVRAAIATSGTPHRSYLSSIQASSMVQCTTLVQSFLRAKAAVNTVQHASKQAEGRLRGELRSASSSSAARRSHTSPDLTSYTRAMLVSRGSSSSSSRHGTAPVMVIPLADVCRSALHRVDCNWHKLDAPDPSFLQPVATGSAAYSAASLSNIVTTPRTYLPI